jgi:hypothetical protein
MRLPSIEILNKTNIRSAIDIFWKNKHIINNISLFRNDNKLITYPTQIVEIEI